MAVALETQEFSGEVKPLPKTPVTYEEFLTLADGRYAEWVNGRIEPRPSQSARHQEVLGFVRCLLAEWVEQEGVGQVSSFFQMHLGQLRRGREPDIIYIEASKKELVHHMYLEGPADLAVEITAPESLLRDRGAKYGEYEAGGVREYWIIDLETQRADFFALDVEGRYQRAQSDADGIYRSAVVPGFWINVGWLWQDPLPTLRRALREWEEAK